MEFVGYTSRGMLDVAEEIYRYNENYVINDNGHFKLAIRMPQCNKVENYALFLWDEFANGNDDERNRIIQLKTEETLYHEVQTIVHLNNGTVERYIEDNNTDVLQNENVVDISVERDYRRNIWLVKLKGFAIFTFDNEASARRVYQIVKRDLFNFTIFRWGKPQR